jgi:glycosyltransferase involved in cell wall biosynthesis
LRILHVVPSYLPATRYGGPIYSVHGLCRALAGLGHEVHVFTTNVDGDGDSDVPLGQPVDLDGVHVWYFSVNRFRRLYYSPTMMRALQRRIADFDVVHLHSVFLWPSWAAARVARTSSVPYVLSPRGMLVRELVRRKSRWLKTCWIRLIETRNIEKASAIHITSKQEADDLGDFRFQLPPVWNIPNGIELPQPWSSDMLNEDVRLVTQQGEYALFLGRINWKKGLDRLIAAWAEVLDTQLVIAGNDEEGYLSELQGIAAKGGIEDRVTFLARFMSGADKEALFSSACLFILPSYSENFGNTVLEAMVRAIPVVVTEEVGAGEVVRKAEGGFVVDGRPESLSNAVKKLIEDPACGKKMGESARRLVAVKYSWAAVAGQMEEAYRNILKAQAGRA